MSQTESYYRGYRIVFTQGVWVGRYLEITPTHPELAIMHTPRIVFSGSATAALEDAHRRIDDLLR